MKIGRREFLIHASGAGAALALGAVKIGEVRAQEEAVSIGTIKIATPTGNVRELPYEQLTNPELDPVRESITRASENFAEYVNLYGLRKSEGTEVDIMLSGLDTQDNRIPVTPQPPVEESDFVPVVIFARDLIDPRDESFSHSFFYYVPSQIKVGDFNGLVGYLDDLQPHLSKDADLDKLAFREEPGKKLSVFSGGSLVAVGEPLGNGFIDWKEAVAITPEGSGRPMTEDELQGLSPEMGEMTSGYEMNIDGHKFRVVTNHPRITTDDADVAEFSQYLKDVGFVFGQDITTVEIRDAAKLQSEGMRGKMLEILKGVSDSADELGGSDHVYILQRITNDNDYGKTIRYVVYVTDALIDELGGDIREYEGKTYNMAGQRLNLAVVTALIASISRNQSGGSNGEFVRNKLANRAPIVAITFGFK